MSKTIFVAGATGAIGSCLVPSQRLPWIHGVWLMTRRESRVDVLRGLGRRSGRGRRVRCARLSDALLAARPDIVIHQLTDLPPGLDPVLLEAALGRNARIREEGTARPDGGRHP